MSGPGLDVRGQFSTTAKEVKSTSDNTSPYAKPISHQMPSSNPKPPTSHRPKGRHVPCNEASPSPYLSLQCPLIQNSSYHQSNAPAPPPPSSSLSLFSSPLPSFLTTKIITMSQSHLRPTPEMLNLNALRQSLKAFASSPEKTFQILKTLPYSDARLTKLPERMYVLDSSFNPPTRARECCFQEPPIRDLQECGLLTMDVHD